MASVERRPRPGPSGGPPDEGLEDAIRAVAHPGRRAMLRLVWEVERPAGDLADAAGLSPSAASQHLRLLREAGLMTVRTDGNRRLYRADLGRVGAVARFLDGFWAAPLARLRMAAEAEAASGPATPATSDDGTGTERSA